MLTGLKHITTILFLAVFFLPQAMAGSFKGMETGRAENGRDWNAVLSRYSSLCDSCLMLRARVGSGISVSQESAQRLITRFVSLNKNIKDSASELSESQKAEFRRTTRRFLTAISGGGKADDIVLDPLPEMFGIMDDYAAWKEQEDYPAPATMQDRPVTEEPDPELPMRKKVAFGIQAVISVPVPAEGLMLSVRKGRWGGWCRLSSNFKGSSYAYSCNSEGRIDDGSYVWTQGVTRKSYTEITAGVITSVTDWLSVYAGAGCGKKVLLWKDLDSQWVKVSDKSFSGAAAEVGVMFKWKHLTLSSGLSTTAFRMASANIGIGVSF